MPLPLCVSRVSVTEGDTLPSPPVSSKLGNYFVMSPADDTKNVRRAPPRQQGDKSARNKVCKVWGSKSPILVDADLSLPRPADPTPPPPRAADSSSASLSPVTFNTSDVYTTKPPVGRGELLLRFCRQTRLPQETKDPVRVVEPELLHVSMMSSQPHVVVTTGTSQVLVV